AYEYFRNDIFDGRNVFQTTGNKPELRQNQYGGSIGGPIFKNKTFFYFDYEGFRQVSGVTDTGTVPTLAEYNDINSIGGSTPQALFSTYNGTSQAYNGTLPGTTGPVAINPIMLNYLKLFPAPTNSNLSGNFTISPNKTQNSNTYDARVDHKFNDRNLFFGRFAYNSVNTFTPPNFGTVNGIEVSGGRYNFDGPATDIAQQYSFGYTHIFTSNLLLDLRAGFTRINNLSLPLNYGKNVDQAIGYPASMTAFSPFANSLTPVSIGPFGDIGDGAYVPLQDVDNTFQYSGTLSWTKGNHNIKAGLALVRRQARNVQSASAAGFYQFNTSADNNIPTADIPPANNPTQAQLNQKQLDIQSNQLASSLLGAFGSQTRDYNISAPDYRSWEPGGFVQDSWKATPKLTVIAGVRYDVFTPFTEAHNHISNFDYPEALTLSATNINDALKVAGQNGVNSQVNIPTDYSNVAPRLGFAYSVSPTLVLRGGYGLSFFPGNYTSNADLKNAPFNSAYGPSCQSSLSVLLEASVKGASTGQNPDCAIPSIGAPGAISSTEAIPAPPTTPQAVPPLASITGLTFVAEAPKFKSALIQQFNLQLEQQFGSNVFTIGYVGSIGQHLPESVDNINQPAPFNPITNPGGSVRPLGVVLPNLSGISYMQSEGISNYNGLQTSFQRRFTHGLAFDANYTWAKALADISSFSQQGDQGWSHADPTRIRQIEYGKSDTDIQNRFALALNYELQYGKEFTGIKKAFIAGWQTNIITAWQSGKVFSIVNSGSGADNPIESDGAAHGFNNRACPQNCNGPDRPSQIGDARLAHKSLSEFFNTAAFIPQPLGTVGNVQRNSLFGPDFRHVDLSLFKNFPIRERFNVQFRVETFNISNTPNFYIRNNGQPEQQFGNAGFGQITQTDPNYNPRQYQFALKLQF
ncbi:MAG TPA: TonB-dependent receptor, partial [Granulicella sp.]